MAPYVLQTLSYVPGLILTSSQCLLRPPDSSLRAASVALRPGRDALRFARATSLVFLNCVRPRPSFSNTLLTLCSNRSRAHDVSAALLLRTVTETYRVAYAVSCMRSSYSACAASVYVHARHSTSCLRLCSPAYVQAAHITSCLRFCSFGLRICCLCYACATLAYVWTCPSIPTSTGNLFSTCRTSLEFRVVASYVLHKPTHSRGKYTIHTASHCMLHVSAAALHALQQHFTSLLKHITFCSGSIRSAVPFYVLA